MQIDVDYRNLIPLAEAARRIPGRPHISTIHRWRLRGVRGIKLRTWRLGGRRFTSTDAIEDFLAAVTAAADGQCPAAGSAAHRRQRAAQAERELDDAGI